MSPPGAPAARARAAAESVHRRFGRRLLGLPGTYLPRVLAPGRARLGPWHYWWLAHYLDGLVDEVHRELRGGDDERARRAGTRAVRLLRTVRLRNGASVRNDFFDDMAWLALAAARLAALQQRRPDVTGPSTLPAAAGEELSGALEAGILPEGGVFWNVRRDLVSLAATAPVALHLARRGERARAGELVDWAYATLLDERSGLFADALRREPDGRWTLVGDVYTYTQGTVLAALVALADAPSAGRAERLVAAMGRSLTDPAGSRVLRGHGGHDGGLFTGIAVRYLALAARSPALSPTARQRAADLVEGTAEALWQGRARHGRRRPALVFSPAPAVPAAQVLAPGSPVELSAQVQAWTVLEAAATLPR